MAYKDRTVTLTVHSTNIKQSLQQTVISSCPLATPVSAQREEGKSTDLYREDETTIRAQTHKSSMQIMEYYSAVRRDKAGHGIGQR